MLLKIKHGIIIRTATELDILKSLDKIIPDTKRTYVIPRFTPVCE